jgi:hypothetical protein
LFCRANIQTLEAFWVMRVEIVKAWTQFPTALTY